MLLRALDLAGQILVVRVARHLTARGKLPPKLHDELRWKLFRGFIDAGAGAAHIATTITGGDSSLAALAHAIRLVERGASASKQ